MVPRTYCVFLACLCICLSTAAARGGDEPPPFGFRGVEIFRASTESVGLLALDLDGDRRLDLVYADNEDATIRLLIQKAPGEEAKAQAGGSGAATTAAPRPAEAAPAKAEARTRATAAAVRRSVNQVESDDRFRVERFYTEKKVTSLAAADFDGDQKPDLAYYGDPKELEVIFQSGEWGSRREKYPITDGSESAEALAAVDLDGDGKVDLVLLGAGKTYLFRQRPEGGGLEKPRTIYNSFSDVSELLLGDLDGDRRLDLVLLRPRASHPFLLRFQRPPGPGSGGEAISFGPEVPVKSLPIHRAVLDSASGGGPGRILAIQGNTRRIRALSWAKKERREPPAISEPRLYGLRPEGDAALRRVQIGDVNGDGRPDLVTSSAETAELDVYLQDGRGDLSPPSASPSLAEVKGIAIADVDGDGSPEVVVASAREKAVGVSRWLETGRLSIPETHSLEKEPLLVAAARFLPPGDPHGGKGAQIALVSKGSDGKFQLSIRTLAAPVGLATLAETTFDAGAEPSGLVPLDADGDGALDLMVFVPYEDPRLYLLETGGGTLKLREASSAKDFGIGQLSRLAPAAFSSAPSLGPPGKPEGAGGKDAAPPRGQVMLVAQKSFARALVLDGGRLRVLEQFSGRGAAADIAGACAIDLDGDPAREVLLYDRAESAVEVLDRTPQGVYRLLRSIPLPGIEFQGFRVLDLNGDGKEDVAVLGKQAVAVLYQGGEEYELAEKARYDAEDPALGPEQERGLPDRLIAGDLNGDGVGDVVFATEPRYLLGLLSPEHGKAGGTLDLRLAFPIFEEKSYMRRQTAGHGPREMLAADVTGDGKTDLLLLIHDRILLYPQD